MTPDTRHPTPDARSQVPDTRSEPPEARPPVRLGRTLRFALRTLWDSLGFVCAISLTLFALAPLAAALAFQAGQVIGAAPALAGIALALVLPPLYAGACLLTHRILDHDEPSYGDLWRGFRQLYGRAVALGLLQIVMSAILAANLLFYLSRGGPVFLLLAVLFVYLSLFWGMNAFYHWPLLIAGEVGIIRREDGGKPGLKAVLRNAFLLAASAPGYTLGLLLATALVLAPLAVSGVGMALLGPGLATFVTTQATRDQLVRFGVLPAPPDPDAPVADEGWKLG